MTTALAGRFTRYSLFAAAAAALALGTTSCADDDTPTPAAVSAPSSAAPSSVRNSDKWPAAWPYDTSWSDATVAGVPCRIGPGETGHTERVVQPFYPPTTNTVCTQLIPGGHGATYQ